MKRGSIVNALLILIVLAALIAGAIACWHTPEPPPIDRCPPHDPANPWCGR